MYNQVIFILCKKQSKKLVQCPAFLGGHCTLPYSRLLYLTLPEGSGTQDLNHHHHYCRRLSCTMRSQGMQVLFCSYTTWYSKAFKPTALGLTCSTVHKSYYALSAPGRYYPTVHECPLTLFVPHGFQTTR